MWLPPVRLVSIVSATLVLLVTAVLDTAAQGPVRAYPSIPGAVSSPPAWLGKDVPFDVAAYFDAPPPAQNAAPLYLDALFEFSGDLAGCFPSGPETEARAKAARERAQRLRPLTEAFTRDPSSVDRAALKAVLPSYQTGFQKLGQAQQRSRCVFESGLGVTSVMPHAQATREVVWVVCLRTLASLDRGDIDGAIANVTGALRMARDLQRRGGSIPQLVYAAEVRLLTKSAVTPILSHPKLTAAQCDRLIKAFTEHEARALDGYSEALKAKYVVLRTTLHDVSGRPGDRDRTAADKAKADTLAILEQLVQDPQQKARVQTIKAELPNATSQQYADAVAAGNTYYRNLLAAAKLPYAEKQARVQSVSSLPETKAGAPLELTRVLQTAEAPELRELILTLTRAEASERGVEAMAAVRRWQVAHKALPKDLAAACKEAGLKAVPVDPFAASQTIKFVVLNGQPLVYSIGKDGKDDGGKVDSKNESQPGDFTLRLDPPAQRR